MKKSYYVHKHNYHYDTGNHHTLCATNVMSCCLTFDMSKVTCKGCINSLQRSMMLPTCTSENCGLIVN